MRTILHIGSKLCKNGGIENYIMNLYRKIDKSEFKFIFLVEKNQDDDNFSEEIIEFGGEIYYFDSEKPIYSQIIQKYSILKGLNFDVAHVHVSCGVRAIDGLLAKLANKKTKLFFHSHSNIGNRPIKYSLLIPIYRMISDRLFACSNAAAKYFFGNNVIKSKKYQLMKNAIDPLNFIYSDTSRKKIRSDYSINESVFLLGYVGRLSPEKNVGYLIDVVCELNNQGLVSKGMIVGDGPEKELLNQYALQKEQQKNIIFVGNSSNVGEYLSAYDAMILPSHNEGLGIVLIEAQAASLVCFASDVVPEETNISPLIQYIDVRKPAKFTATVIQNYIKNSNIKRPCNNTCVDSSGYNVNISIKEWEKIYLDT